MNAELFQCDMNGKLLICGASEFVSGGASRQCTRPNNHTGPHAFPIDSAHLVCQREMARLQSERDAARSSAKAAHDQADLYAAEFIAAKKELVDALRMVEALRDELRTAADRLCASFCLVKASESLRHTDACRKRMDVLAGVLST